MPHVTTNDGVRLHYVEKGSGAPLVMIPGWSQTAAQFEAQVEGLSASRRVIAFDMRGHGESDKPEHGYKIQRLAMDLRNAVETLGLEQVSLLGHSMGCSVIWCYIDLFGEAGLERLVLVDQMPSIAARDEWSEQEKQDAGAIFDGASLYETIAALAGKEGVGTTKGFIGSMFTGGFPAERVEWVIEQNRKMPRRHAATLLLNHATQDWRDLIPRITLPTLIVGGRVSLIDWRSQEWMHRQIAGSQLEIFEEADGGNHFMFLENPERFNNLVDAFLG
ncbi:MAG: alpha/beta hydrolase [Rhodospirillaceae bacterium]|nr:alpha/beta hydrolase [Rhodospirillaceae bacterium]